MGEGEYPGFRLRDNSGSAGAGTGACAGGCCGLRTRRSACCSAPARDGARSCVSSVRWRFTCCASWMVFVGAGARLLPPPKFISSLSFARYACWLQRQKKPLTISSPPHSHLSLCHSELFPLLPLLLALTLSSSYKDTLLLEEGANFVLA